MSLVVKSLKALILTACLAASNVPLASIAQDVDDVGPEEEYELCTLLATSGPPNDDLKLNAPFSNSGCSAHSVRLESVEIYGDRPFGKPGSFSVLTGADIEQTAADHPAEILNQLPGMNVQMNSGQENLIALRSPVLTGGAGQGSVLVLENGVPTRSPAFGNVNALIEPHHEVAQAIEVVRGPGSAKYGSNAVHGLINVISGRTRYANEAHVSYGSLGRYKGDLILEDSHNYRAALSLQHDIGWRDNTGVDQQKLSLGGQFDWNQWEIKPWLSISNLEQETATFLQGADAYKDRDLATTNSSPEAYRNAFSARAASRFQREFRRDGELVITPYVHTQSMQFAQHFLPNGGVEKNGHTGAGVLTRYKFVPADDVTLRVGADVDMASGFLKEVQLQPFGFFPGDNRFPEGIHYDYTVATVMGALWGEAEWQPTANLSILAGLRLEAHEYDYSTDAPVGTAGRFQVTPNRSDSFNLITPKLGAVYDAGEISYYANYARGQRAPQASDLYRLQSLQVPGEVEEETLDSIEIGLRGSVFDDRLVFDAAAYWMEKDNFFFRDSDGLNVPDGSTEHQGVELAANFAFTRQLSLSGQLSWSDQTYTFDRMTGSASNTIHSGDQIDTAPEWLGDIALNWSGDKFSAGLSAEYVGEYFTNPANTRKYDGHIILNARASYPVAEGLEVYLNVRNLTDETYADRADFAFGNERYFPGEPVNATLGLHKTF